MASLQVFLFGVMKVIKNQEPSEIKLTRTSQLLLAYLLLERCRQHSRDVLIELFWGEYSQDRARRCLNTALWRLRQAIEKNSASEYPQLIVSQAGEVGFNNESKYWLDVEVFEECINRVKKKPIDKVRQSEVEELETKLQLYVGELLEGIYTDWAVRAREYERLQYLDGLLYLMEYYKLHNAYLRCLEFGQKILEADPLREEIHREMMRLYLATGQRSSAVRQYEICCQNLSAELGILPMEETQTLYAHILSQKSRHSPTPTAEEAADLREVIANIQQAAQNLEFAHEQFRKAMNRLETILPVDE